MTEVKTTKNRNLIIILVFLGIFALFLCICGFVFMILMMFVPINNSISPAPNEIPVIETLTKPDEEFFSQYSVGDEVTFGEYSLTVNSFEPSSSQDITNLEAGKTMYLLDLTFENLTNQPYELFLINFFVVDENDEQFILTFDIPREPVLEQVYMMEPREILNGWAGVLVDDTSKVFRIERINYLTGEKSQININ